MTNLPPIFRLIIFLLLSLGLHGGLAFYEWSNDLGDSGVTAAPVVVTLLPAAKPIQRLAKTQPGRVPDPSPEPSRSTLKPKVVTPVEKIKKASVKKNPQARIVEKVAVDSSAPEMVCPTPPEADVEASSSTVAVASVPVEETVLLASLGKGDVEAVDQASPYATSLVEAIPHYRSNPLPEYPRLARKKHWEGVVWLLVGVSADGVVEDLEVEKTCGHRVLDRAALRTVKHWQFSPATRGDLPVSSQVRIPVRFRLKDG